MITYWLIGEKSEESQTSDESRHPTPNTLSRNPTITYDQAPDSPLSPKTVSKPTNHTERPKPLELTRMTSQDDEESACRSKESKFKRFNQTPASSLDLSSLSGSHSSLEFPQETGILNMQDLCYKNGTGKPNQDLIVSSVKVKDVVDKFNHTIADATKRVPSKKTTNSAKTKN